MPASKRPAVRPAALFCADRRQATSSISCAGGRWVAEAPPPRRRQAADGGSWELPMSACFRVGAGAGSCGLLSINQLVLPILEQAPMGTAAPRCAHFAPLQVTYTCDGHKKLRKNWKWCASAASAADGRRHLFDSAMCFYVGRALAAPWPRLGRADGQHPQWPAPGFLKPCLPSCPL